MRVLSPLRWVGGKHYLVNRLLGLIPPHTTYVEVFGGAAHLLFAKEPVTVEVYNDINSDLVNFFRVLRDEEKCKELQRRLYFTPYSREEYEYAYLHYSDAELDDIERARLFFVVVRQGFGGIITRKAWGYNVTESERISKQVRGYMNCIERLLDVSHRFRRVYIEHDDYRNVMERFLTSSTFCYCDPPYHPDTCGKDLYVYEFSRERHIEIIKFLLEYRGMVMLSGYDHSDYSVLVENGWKRFEFKSKAHCALKKRNKEFDERDLTGERSERLDVVWLNPLAWQRLQNNLGGLFDGNEQQI